MPIYDPTPAERAHQHRRTEERMAQLDERFRRPNQILGRRSTIGCVALEVTQRCNMDCAVCYLSHRSRRVPDPPVAELCRRLDRIKDDFGVQTNVQITGGEPTLRSREDLVAIVRHAARIGLYPALFSNGVRASRDLLAELADAGLMDLALHVDLTQGRAGYESEAALCAVRDEYLERGRGLGLAIIFNTTVVDRNAGELPALVRYFVRRAGALGMASFQLQADTGRGTLPRRDPALTKERVRALIDEGCGRRLSWDAVLFGHPRCHDIAYAIVSAGKVVDLFDDRAVLERWLAEFTLVPMDRAHPVRSGLSVLRHVLTRRPGWVGIGGGWALRKAAEVIPPALAQALRERRAPQLGKLSFLVEEFQDRDDLDAERIRNCSFHAATGDGSVSMCAHNARRDEYV